MTDFCHSAREDSGPQKAWQEDSNTLAGRLEAHVKLTKLTAKQAEYLGVPVSGPYKSEHYRY